jgi:hypothetical protein
MTSTTAPSVLRNAGVVQVAHVPIPDDVDLPPLPSRDDQAFHYQRVLLNVRTGQLSFFCSDWRVRVPAPKRGEDRSLWDSQHPGHNPITSVGFATKPVPEVLSFLIDTWTAFDRGEEDLPTRPWVHMTREQGEAFVASLVPLAQQLVDNLFLVPGTDDLEWSAESAAVVRAISEACGRDHQGPDGVEVSTAGMVNFGDVVDTVPAMVRSNWANLNNTDLDDVADSLNRSTRTWYPVVTERFGKLSHDGTCMVLDVYGARSWLYAYRAHQAGNCTVADAATAWFTNPDHTLTRRVMASHDDAALTELAAIECAAAAEQGIKLVGVEAVLRAYRDELRARILEVALPQAAATVKAGDKAKATRADLLKQIISWGDARFFSDNDAELGRQAGLTRQAVNLLRKQLPATDENTTED